MRRKEKLVVGGVESEFKDSVNSRVNSPRGLYLRILHLLVGSAFSRVERLEIAAIFEKEIFRFEIAMNDHMAMAIIQTGYNLLAGRKSLLSAVILVYICTVIKSILSLIVLI